jgi:Leucine-rich repeat (LRR) protein
VVPNAVLGLSRLRWLCLGGNHLERLPVGRYLETLERLVLVDNRFSDVPVEALSLATALTCLTMGGNPSSWTAPEAEFVKRIPTFHRTHQDKWRGPWW